MLVLTDSILEHYFYHSYHFLGTSLTNFSKPNNPVECSVLYQITHLEITIDP
jgi:aryl carrier-like protein